MPLSNRMKAQVLLFFAALKLTQCQGHSHWYQTEEFHDIKEKKKKRFIKTQMQEVISYEFIEEKFSPLYMNHVK